MFRHVTGDGKAPEVHHRQNERGQQHEQRDGDDAVEAIRDRQAGARTRVGVALAQTVQQTLHVGDNA